MQLTGHVIRGRQLGRTIEFPTANVAAADSLPADYGVYAVHVRLDDGRQFRGVCNLGVKPTVGSDHALLEVHIFDFDGNLYGRVIETTLIHKLRSEFKFESVTALRAQLQLDKAQARALLSQHSLEAQR